MLVLLAEHLLLLPSGLVPSSDAVILLPVRGVRGPDQLLGPQQVPPQRLSRRAHHQHHRHADVTVGRIHHLLDLGQPG